MKKDPGFAAALAEATRRADLEQRPMAVFLVEGGDTYDVRPLLDGEVEQGRLLMAVNHAMLKGDLSRI